MWQQSPGAAYARPCAGPLGVCAEHRPSPAPRCLRPQAGMHHYSVGWFAPEERNTPQRQEFKSVICNDSYVGP